MDLLTFTHVVTRAGAAMGFSVMVTTAMCVYYSRSRQFSALKQRTIWLPWAGSALTMVLASAITGGFLGKVSGALTGTGNAAGAAVGHAAIGQDGAGAAHITVDRVMSYSGSWLVLLMVVGMVLFLWFAKSWKERALAVSGALTGATWGIASSLGGWAAAVGIPLVSWLGDTVIG